MAEQISAKSLLRSLAATGCFDSLVCALARDNGGSLAGCLLPSSAQPSLGPRETAQLRSLLKEKMKRSLGAALMRRFVGKKTAEAHLASTSARLFQPVQNCAFSASDGRRHMNNSKPYMVTYYLRPSHSHSLYISTRLLSSIPRWRL